VAGLFAGIVFLIAQMGWAVQRLDLPAVAPLLDMSTIFNGVDTMPMVTPDNLLIGLVTHLTLTMLFGSASPSSPHSSRARSFWRLEASRSGSCCTW